MTFNAVPIWPLPLVCILETGYVYVPGYPWKHAISCSPKTSVPNLQLSLNMPEAWHTTFLGDDQGYPNSRSQQEHLLIALFYEKAPTQEMKLSKTNYSSNIQLLPSLTSNWPKRLDSLPEVSQSSAYSFHCSDSSFITTDSYFSLPIQAKLNLKLSRLYTSKAFFASVEPEGLWWWTAAGHSCTLHWHKYSIP